MSFKKVSIIGLGLIGGSLGMSLCRSGSVEEVAGYDLSPEAGREALARRAIHKQAPDPETAVAGADLVILAVPVERIPEIAARIGPVLKEGAILTDVASTKARLAATVPPLLPPGVYYVGGHPMAGMEASGIAAADPFLFQNAVYLLTPAEETPAEVRESLLRLVRLVGGIPYFLRPEEHDLMVAAVSHLPHLTAAALVNTACRLEREQPGTLSLAAGGFRDSTRIALGSPALWREIFRSNREPLLEVLKVFLDELRAFQEEIAGDQPGRLENRLAAAARAREELPVKHKGFLTLLHELVVVIEDRPGAIAGVVSLLAAAELNIKDIEILRIREGEGGTLRLAFENAPALAEAVRILRAEGYQVQERGGGRKG
ncbi:MAG: prephenate dehydrogenase/arogenate dehydrogenase family protein [Firmicutes bacterium]|jgi:prephenate dehydrogenase|nr:prephenate dehydrogenase/arogenate dehydrogenase family protein [Bacillota bacterium]